MSYQKLCGGSGIQWPCNTEHTDGKAILHAAGHTPPHERPVDDDELWLTTGRTVYQFHTRTKTARAPQLNDAAPQVWVELAPGDAARRGIGDGDMAVIRSPRGCVQARARVGGIRDGVAFLPFHYGYWDTDGAEHQRAANELTITDWDPVSKQPLFKTSVVRIDKGAEADRSG